MCFLKIDVTNFASEFTNQLPIFSPDGSGNYNEIFRVKMGIGCYL